MRPSSGRINIATSAQKLDVDNRISLRYYFRIADNILRQADIFREEQNIVDLYVMLLRFSSLVSETIPCHRDYRASYGISFKKKLLKALHELEKLKPAVQQKLEELDKDQAYQTNACNRHHQVSSLGSSVEWPLLKMQTMNSFGSTKTSQPVLQEFAYKGVKTRQLRHAKPVEEQFRQLALIARPKEETLSRHSILGPNGLYGQWHPPSSSKGVVYPSNIDLTPVEIPSMQSPVRNGIISGDKGCSDPERSNMNSTPPNSDSHNPTAMEHDSLISFETIESPIQTEIIRQPSPPPVLADVQDLIPTTASPIKEAEHILENPSYDGLVCSDSPMPLHISTELMNTFLKLAKSNTDKNLETCGVLAGSLKNRKFYVTALIIPKQESTSDSCQTTNEEEIFEVQDKQSLFPLGWIHTHPTQSCFMSSIDLHTHYSYQIMLPEAIAIVMAPRDSSRTHGIFRLTSPGGMTVIRHCSRRGFHPHDPPPDGGPIYRQCTDVYMNSDLKLDVIDLR